MAQDITDYFDGNIGLKHTCGETMPEKVEPMWSRVLIKPCAPKSLVHYPRKIVIWYEGFERSLVADENVPHLCWGTTIAKVLNEGLGHLGKKGQAKLLACFRLIENDATITPMDVVKVDLTDIRWSYSVSRNK
jgi:hypothetical protein